MSSSKTEAPAQYRPDIGVDQVAFLRQALGTISIYAATQYSTPSPDARLSLVAQTADAVYDLANAWDWGGYDNAQVASECLTTLRKLKRKGPELLTPIVEQLEEVVERLKREQKPESSAVNTEDLEQEAHC